MQPDYYNEIDPFCIEWLHNLMTAGLLPHGEVDGRDIRAVHPDDLRGFRSCHFFAGIGGWPLALRLAGWSRPVWTGSCPCQPFSSAGAAGGLLDERHLWPPFRRLIQVRRPADVLGEQVASADGRAWFSGVRLEMEALGYAFGGADLCSASIGADHIRQRLYWWGTRELAHTGHDQRGGRDTLRSAAQVHERAARADGGSREGGRREGGRREGGERALHDYPDGGAGIARSLEHTHGDVLPDGPHLPDAGRAILPDQHGTAGGLAESQGERRGQRHGLDGEPRGAGSRRTRPTDSRGVGDAGDARPSLPQLGDLPGARRGQEGRATQQPSHASTGAMADTGSSGAGREAHAAHHAGQEVHGSSDRAGGRGGAPDFSMDHAGGHGREAGRLHHGEYDRLLAAAASEYVYCADGVFRRIEPGTFPLAYGIPQGLGRGEPRLKGMVKRARTNRIGRLKGYGNAIDPRVAVEFIRAVMECQP